MLRSGLYLLNRFILNKKYLTAKSHHFNLKFKFKTEDCVGRSIYKKGDFESDIAQYLLDNLKLKSTDIVIDVGANIGWYSILLARYSSAMVYAFEPDPLNFELFERNILINNVKNIFPIKSAVSDEIQILKLYRYRNSNLGRHSMLPFNTNSMISVNATSLDYFIKDKNIDPHRVAFMKMDIEGYEYVALKGAKKLLGIVPFILSEYSPKIMRNNNIDPKLYLEILTTAGYTPLVLKKNRLEKVATQALLDSEIDIMNVFWRLGSSC